jgi:hypothetical protein
MLNLGDITTVVLHNPKNTDAVLNEIVETINRLTADPRYAVLNPDIRARATVHNPKNPDAFLEDV